MTWLLVLLIFVGGIGTLGAQDFYDPTVVNEIRLYFTQTNWDQILDQLYAAGEERLLGTAIINGVTYDSVGVRYKGNSTYNANRAKNPFNIKIDYIIDNQKIDGIYGTVKLANGAMDPSLVREVLSYEIARNYMPAGLANYAVVYVNDVQIGVYTNVQDVDKSFAATHLYCSNMARFKADNDQMQLQQIWGYENADSNSYMDRYQLESDTGWEALTSFLYQYNNATNYSDFLDLDRHLWMLAFDNLMVNLDAPVNFDHNYYLFQDAAGRFVPILWDLNMSFGGFTRDLAGTEINQTGLQQLAPLFHVGNSHYPILTRVLTNPTYKRMYIAHMRTILTEYITIGLYSTRAHQLQSFIAPFVQDDPNYLYSYANFLANVDATVTTGGGGPGGPQSSVIGITQLMNNRGSYLNNHSLFQGTIPTMTGITYSPSELSPNMAVNFTVNVSDATAVYLNYRQDRSQPFANAALFNDGLHGDGAANDNVWGLSVLIGTGDLQYYCYAENTMQGVFSPARASKEFYTAEVTGATGNVVINEINYNSNGSSDTGDWVEITNPGSVALDISGWVFKDENDSHIFTIPMNTILDAGGYLVLCENVANFYSLFPEVTNYVGNIGFGLSGSGELVRIFDSNGTLIDAVTYDDNAPWPTAADGFGATLELSDPLSDNALGENWAADGSIHGTPGAQNSVTVIMQIEWLRGEMVDNDFMLTWAPVDGATSYNVYRSTTPGGYAQIGTVDSAYTTFTDANAGSNSSKYFYCVTAVR